MAWEGGMALLGNFRSWTGLLMSMGLVFCAHAGPTVAVCDDVAGWPPFAYADPDEPAVVKGATIELVGGILARAGYTMQTTLLPWKRCLSDVEEGRLAMVINASLNEERVQKYLVTKPLYVVHSALYYLNERYPQAPVLSKPADLKAHSFCGLFGYNYTMYDIPPANLDTSAHDEATRFRMLRNGRCDFALGDVEVLNAFVARGQLDMKGVEQLPIPGAKPKEFHTLVSRNYPDAEKLVKIINDGLSAARADKSYWRTLKKYGL